MDDRSARRDLALAAVTVVGLSRLLEPPLIWLVAGGAARGDAARHAPGPRRRGGAGRRPGSASRSSRSSCRRSRRSPVSGRSGWCRSGCGSCPALAITWLIVGRTLALEARINRGTDGADRRRPDVRCWSRSCWSRSSAFTGVAAMVPGGLVQAGGALGREQPARSSPRATRSSPACSATGRPSLRVTDVRDALWSAADLRGGDRDRRRGAAGDGDPAAGRAGAADPRVLPVGRVHRHRAVAPPRPALDLADRRCWPASGVVVVAWNLLLRG